MTALYRLRNRQNACIKGGLNRLFNAKNGLFMSLSYSYRGGAMSQKWPSKRPSNAYFSFCVLPEVGHLNGYLRGHLLFLPPVSRARPVWGKKRRLKGYSPPFEKSSDTPVQRPTPTGSGLHRKTPFYALVLPSWMSPAQDTKKPPNRAVFNPF